jgi:hypothetical protein
MGKTKTYNSREVLISFGNHSVTGYAEDSFINIEKNGDGFSDVVGCDGEQIRSMDPDDTYNITLALLQSSPSNAFLQNKNNQDNKNGDGFFPVTIKDLRGGLVFNCEEAWAVNPAARPFGKTAQNREWSLRTSTGKLEDSEWK